MERSFAGDVPAKLQGAWLALGALALLTACAGGRIVPGTPGALGSPPGAPLSGAGGSAPETEVRVWGLLVDEQTNRPLANVPVRLDPWKPCTVVKLGRERTSLGVVEERDLRCPQPLRHLSTDRHGRFSLRAKPGHYLLVIGDDKPNDLRWATIHDSIFIHSHTRRLLAPEPCPTLYTYHISKDGVYHADGPPFDGRCLPPIPGAHLQPSQRNGDYRLTQLQPEEHVCALAFNQERKAYGVEPASVDEWITENNRANDQTTLAHDPFPANAFPLLTEGFGAEITNGDAPGDGHNGCWWALIGTNVFTHTAGGVGYAADPRTHWFGASMIPWHDHDPKSAWVGQAQYPRDPRNVHDPAVRYWP